MCWIYLLDTVLAAPMKACIKLSTSSKIKWTQVRYDNNEGQGPHTDEELIGWKHDVVIAQVWQKWNSP